MSLTKEQGLARHCGHRERVRRLEKGVPGSWEAGEVAGGQSQRALCAARGFKYNPGGNEVSFQDFSRFPVEI